MFQQSNSIVLGPEEDVNPVTVSNCNVAPIQASSNMNIIQGLENLNSEKNSRLRPGDSELSEFLKVFLVKDKEEQRCIDKEVQRKERKERKKEKRREFMMCSASATTTTADDGIYVNGCGFNES
jgi:hypothetical protein